MGMKMICIQVTQPQFEKLSIYLFLKVCYADLITTAIFFELIVEHEQKIVALKQENYKLKKSTVEHEQKIVVLKTEDFLSWSFSCLSTINFCFAWIRQSSIKIIKMLLNAGKVNILFRGQEYGL